MLESVLPKLRSMASGYSVSTLETTDDVFQEMVLACLEKGAKNPEFFNQKTSYILHAGRLKAFNLMREKDIFDRFCYFPDDDENGESDLDYAVSDSLNPEDALIYKQELEGMAKGLEALSNQEKMVVTLSIQGVSTSEIAGQLGVTPAAVSCYKTRAANKLHGFIENFVVCNHKNTVLDVTGTMAFSGGDVCDTISERLICLDCGSILDPEPTSLEFEF